MEKGLRDVEAVAKDANLGIWRADAPYSTKYMKEVLLKLDEQIKMEQTVVKVVVPKAEEPEPNLEKVELDRKIALRREITEQYTRKEYKQIQIA